MTPEDVRVARVVQPDAGQHEPQLREGGDATAAAFIGLAGGAAGRIAGLDWVVAVIAAVAVAVAIYLVLRR